MKHPRSLSILLMLTALAGSSLAAERHLSGRVVRVVDGDSLMLDVRGARYRVELDDIDAPELNQPWGQAARRKLEQSLTGRFVVVQWRAIPANGQVQGRLLSRGHDVGLELLRDGLAWCTLGPVTLVPDQNRLYRDAEAAARAERLGLWSDDSPIPPWEWRRRATSRPH